MEKRLVVCRCAPCPRRIYSTNCAPPAQATGLLAQHRVPAPLRRPSTAHDDADGTRTGRRALYLHERFLYPPAPGDRGRTLKQLAEQDDVVKRRTRAYRRGQMHGKADLRLQRYILHYNGSGIARQHHLNNAGGGDARIR